MGSKRLLPLLALLVLLSACSPAAPAQETVGPEPELTLAATTYPVYLFACQVAGDVPDLRITLVVNQQLSCMHDYSLSITDMKVLEKADAILLNGAGLEEAMEAALEAAGRPQIDCAAGIDLLCGAAHHHDHSHEDGEPEEGEEPDPHIWLDPRRACQMLDNLAQALGELDPAHAARFTANAQAAQEEILESYGQWKQQLAALSPRSLITFHDGFAYFAEAFDLTILEAIEEESGSEASAQEVKEILALLEEHHLPAIFTEVNGATATAQLIGREAGVRVAPLDLLMSSRESPLAGTDLYLSVLAANVSTIQEAYSCA